MTRDQIVEVTNLKPLAAKAAARRRYSEPGLWDTSNPAKEEFLTALSEAGISARQGGRFLTLSFGAIKADWMDHLSTRYDAKITFALGDAPNDVEMLDAATAGAIVFNEHAKQIPVLAGERERRIWRTTAPGPVGWNTAVLAFLVRLNEGAYGHD